MSLSRSTLIAVATGALSASLALAPVAAIAAPLAPAGKGCNVFQYTGAHWATTNTAHPVVLSEYQLSLSPDGNFRKSEQEQNVHSVSSKVTLSASVKASADDVFASVEASVKGSVSQFKKHTSSKIVNTTLSIHNGTHRQHTYVVFSGVEQYTGTAKYYNCVSHSKQGVGTVQVTHRAPWRTFGTRGGGDVQCKTSQTSKLGLAAEAYC